MQTLFLDLDDTFVNTENYIRRVLKNELLPVTEHSVYYMRELDAYREIMEEIFSNYDVIPLCDGAEDSLNILSTEYEVVFCSCAVSDAEENSKKAFADLYKKDIIICREDYAKEKVDMKGCILVDDSLDVLEASRADTRIQIFNPYLAKGLSYKEYLCGDHLAINLPSVVDYLIGGGISNDKSEDLRRTIYKGI